jgi:hypothetical protein
MIAATTIATVAAIAATSPRAASQPPIRAELNCTGYPSITAS